MKYIIKYLGKNFEPVQYRFQAVMLEVMNLKNGMSGQMDPVQFTRLPLEDHGEITAGQLEDFGYEPNRTEKTNDVKTIDEAVESMVKAGDLNGNTLLQAKFDESKINRDKDGKFATKPGGGGGGAKDYTDISEKVRGIVDKNKHRGGYSLNPKTGNVFDATDPKEAKKMYDELAKDNGFKTNEPIYVIGMTNHEGRLGRRLHSVYNRAAEFSSSPLFGYWKSDDTGFSYLDVSYPAQFADDNTAKQQGNGFAQEAVLKISPLGEGIFI